MNRNWTPESKSSITEAGVVIKIKLEGIRTGSLSITFEEGKLCVRGQHEDFGSFECRIEVPPGFSRSKLRVITAKSTLRIEMPPGEDAPFFSDLPKSMLIYCNACGKHFDIVITGNGPRNYRCPACGKVQVFDFEAFVSKAVEQCKTMLGKQRGHQ